jgi:hypothetical protein
MAKELQPTNTNGNGNRRKQRRELPEQAKNLGRFASDPRVAAEAGKLGAIIGNQRKMQKIAERNNLIEEAMKDWVRENMDLVMRPYVEGLLLAPKDEWSPTTKLAFFIDQSGLSEKVANRTEGMPVARRREVDRENNDRVSGVPQAKMESLLADALARALDGGMPDVIDAEIVEEDDHEEGTATAGDP